MNEILLTAMLKAFLKENKCTGVYFSIDKITGNVITQKYQNHPNPEINAGIDSLYQNPIHG